MGEVAVGRWAWFMAILLFGVGDIVTTVLGLGVPGVVEASPSGQLALTYGVVGLKAVKVFVFAGMYVLYRVAPPAWRVGVPLGLALLGLVVVVNNLLVILLAV